MSLVGHHHIDAFRIRLRDCGILTEFSFPFGAHLGQNMTRHCLATLQFAAGIFAKPLRGGFFGLNFWHLVFLSRQPAHYLTQDSMLPA
jgi:hypothetical protein